MITHPSRDIYAVTSPLVPFDFLQSIFIAEAIRPSTRLWLSSPWISDIEVVDNTARQFSSLNSSWPAARIRLSVVLADLIERGCHVIVIVNDDPHNDEFLSRIESLEETAMNRLTTIRKSQTHEKGILGDCFTLNGSMNLTYNGVYINEEYLVYRCDPSVINERRRVLENRWRDYL